MARSIYLLCHDVDVLASELDLVLLGGIDGHVLRLKGDVGAVQEFVGLVILLAQTDADHFTKLAEGLLQIIQQLELGLDVLIVLQAVLSS